MLRKFSLLLIVVLAACDDPAPVGVGLVDEQSGDPFLVEVDAASIDTRPFTEITGNAPRVLFGIVDDPALGTTEAVGHVDFVSSGIKTSAFENGTVSEASLLLVSNYVYGDSTADFNVALRSINESWLGSGAPGDTTLSIGDLVTESTQNLRTVTLEIPLPGTWIARWDTTLRGTTFDDAFHGFEITSASRSAVFGADVLSSAIRAISGGDTTLYPAARSLTRFVQADLPDGEVFTVQDGRGQAAGIQFDFSNQNDDRLVLNRGVVRLPVDLTLSNDTPSGFSRPSIDQLQLDWVSNNESRVSIALATLENERFDFESLQLDDSLRVILQGTSTFSHFEVRPPDGENGISVVRLPLGADLAPQVLFAVTPVQ